MDNLAIFLQIIVALGIVNVWIFRFGKATSWRGGAAHNMSEEFEVYGLPAWSVWLIGGLKLFLAALLVAGIWIPALIQPAAIGIAILMLGAVAMHVKVKDPIHRSLPALIMLVLTFAAIAVA